MLCSPRRTAALQTTNCTSVCRWVGTHQKSYKVLRRESWDSNWRGKQPYRLEWIFWHSTSCWRLGCIRRFDNIYGTADCLQGPVQLDRGEVLLRVEPDWKVLGQRQSCCAESPIEIQDVCQKKGIPENEVRYDLDNSAAIKIQTAYRAHYARKMYKKRAKS